MWVGMMSDWQEITGGVTAPKGYRAAGITAGLKPSGLPDLALILSDVEAIAAGVFTTTQVRAACVDYCRQRLQAKASARAILCNAGQANAATGEQGLRDALESAQLLGEALKIPPESILLASHWRYWSANSHECLAGWNSKTGGSSLRNWI